MIQDSILAGILEQLLPLHDRLCPRQVLGARIGLQGGQLVGLSVPQANDDKRLLVFVETDGCCVDGLSIATGCSVGHRTMRVEDQGKVAATFVDTRTGRSVRVWPRAGAREAALACAPGPIGNRWLAQREGYERLPAHQLLEWQDVQLSSCLADIVSRPHLRVPCSACGEEIMNGREVRLLGGPVCRSCAGQGYLQSAALSSLAA